MKVQNLAPNNKYLFTCPGINQTMSVRYVGTEPGKNHTNYVFKVLAPHWFSDGEYVLSGSAVDEYVVERVTVSVNHPALDRYASCLSSMERGRLMCRMFRGDRFAVFHIDGDRVSLASEQATSELVTA